MGEIRFVNDFTYNPVGEDVAALAIALNRPVKYVDEDGFNIELQTGAIHPKKGWLAWVDYYAKEISPSHVDCNYYLRIQIDEQLALEWMIETYNPFFGCRVCYAAWHDDSIILIYKEKHRCYGASLGLNHEDIKCTLGSRRKKVCVKDNYVFTYDDNTLGHYQLPNWEELDLLSVAEGIELGILEEVI